MEKMLVTQALDERDLMVKKINDKIEKASFNDVKKNNEEKVAGKRVSAKEFTKEAQSGYQQIMDLIDRYQRIESAIVASNANTKVHTSFGDFTVAGAIALRSRMRDSSAGCGEGADFESSILLKMKKGLKTCLDVVEKKNKDLDATAESMRLSILGKDSKVKNDKPLDVVEAYVRENTTALVDPLNVEKKISEIEERREKLLSELDSQIKISNATTFIEF